LLHLDKIILALQDRVLTKVAVATGVSTQTIANIRDGKNASPRYETMLALSDYIKGDDDAG
jgi:transcriptional regulator with XRE-family HTH domain